MIEFHQASKSLDVSASLACWLNLDLGRLGRLGVETRRTGCRGREALLVDERSGSYLDDHPRTWICG